MFTEGLESFEYSVEKALADYANISVEQAKEFTKSIPLSAYMELVNAFDEDNEEMITSVVDRFMDKPSSITEGYVTGEVFNESEFFDFIKTAPISVVKETVLVGNYSIVESESYIAGFSKPIRECFEKFKKAPVAELRKVCETFKVFPNSLAEVRDLYVMHTLAENLDTLEKQKLARLTQTTPNKIVNPQFNDPKNGVSAIVGADDRSGTIAVQNDKGDVNIVSARDPNVKKQITTESVDRLKKLAGI